jgi:hypothetical protein
MLPDRTSIDIRRVSPYRQRQPGSPSIAAIVFIIPLRYIAPLVAIRTPN